jgi:D-sedoheptulose 7-phosphate isomerase
MNLIERYFNELQHTIDQLSQLEIQETIRTLHQARLDGKKIFLMGNGGSASTASHFVCDLAKNTRSDELPDFKVIGLADNMAIFSALANDEGYSNVFAGQLAGLVDPGDVVIGISASGKSSNVLAGIEVANQRLAHTIGFTGFDGGDLARMVEINVHVPSHSIEHVEDIHLMLEHVICKALRESSLEGVPAPLQSNSVYPRQG